jgi:hypothetical protein
MDDVAGHRALQRIVDVLDVSTRDIAEGNLHDAQSVQAEARRLFTDHERAPRAVLGPSAARRVGRARSA